MLGVKKGKVFLFYPIFLPISKYAIFLNTAGKDLRLGATSQASGTALLKNPAAASLPSRALGGAAQGQGLPRGSLKAPLATEKDDGFDVDDWFKDYEVDPEDVDDGQPRSQSPASATQDNKEDENIDIENPAPLPAHPKSQQQPTTASVKPITAKQIPSVEEPLASEEEDRQQSAEDASEEMECELAAENDKAKEEEAATLTAKKTDNSKDTSNENSVDETEEKQLSSDDDLGSLLGIEKADDDDEVMTEAPSTEKALPPAPSKSAKEPEDDAANQKIPSFQFPNLNSRLANNNNKPRVPSRLGPGRAAPPLPAAAALAAKDAAVGGDAQHAAKENANKINENFPPLFPSAITTEAPALASIADGKRKLAAGATPTPITPAGELQACGGAAVITPGTESPLSDSTEQDAPGAKAANPQTAATTTASPATTPPAPPAVDLGDDLLRIDYSARGEQFLLSLEDEEAATQEALATPTAKKVFSLSTSVASAGVDTESLSKRVEDVEVTLAMMRLRYALDAVEVSIKAPTPAAAECLGSDGGGVNNEEEAMEIDF